ncbi:unnamed protein product [Calypogeia fissa]
MMASALPMDAADASDLSRRHGGGALAVNKSSGKIGKGLRRPVAQPRPAPTVYKIEAGHFRSLVQELTGTAPTELVAPKPIGNSRLSKIAPPPLRPTFSYPKFGVPQPMQQFSSGLPPLPSPTNGQRFNTNNIPFSGFGSAQLSPLSQRMGNFPAILSPHTFSPLPVLSPTDQMWANTLESPNSAAMRQLAQSLAAAEPQQHQHGGDSRLDHSNNNGGGLEVGGGASSAQGQNSVQSSASSSNSFSLSPRTQFSNLPLSPTGIGMASGFGIGNIYQMGALHSPTSGLGMDFAFPEPDFMLAGFS